MLGEQRYVCEQLAYACCVTAEQLGIELLQLYTQNIPVLNKTN